MKRSLIQNLLLVILLPCLFSCHSRSGNATKEAADSLVTANKTNKPQSTTRWIIDTAASKVEFIESNLGKNVHGTMGGLKGNILFDEKNLKASSFDASVDVNTIHTGNNKRDRDLLKKKYLNGKEFKQITIRSDSILRDGKDFIAGINLTIKGKVQHLDVPFTFEVKGNGNLKGKITINRHDFDIGGGGPIVGTNIEVGLEIVTKRK